MLYSLKYTPLSVKYRFNKNKNDIKHTKKVEPKVFDD